MSNSLLKDTDKQFNLTPLGKIRLTENQKKVIAEKYLKNAASVEEWLWGVCKNIAFAELLFHPSNSHWGLFDGVRFYKRETASPQPPSTWTWLFHSGIHSASEREINFRRFIQNCSTLTEKNPEAKEIVEKWALTFYDLLSTWKFLPNSPTLMNANRELQQLSACYVCLLKILLRELQMPFKLKR
jgi:ribonucleotide reductase alpha subunit